MRKAERKAKAKALAFLECIARFLINFENKMVLSSSTYQRYQGFYIHELKIHTGKSWSSVTLWFHGFSAYEKQPNFICVTIKKKKLYLSF